MCVRVSACDCVCTCMYASLCMCVRGHTCVYDCNVCACSSMYVCLRAGGRACAMGDDGRERGVRLAPRAHVAQARTARRRVSLSAKATLSINVYVCVRVCTCSRAVRQQ